ncbi:MAG TPA: hypothetical protein O0X79_05870, partial [Methanocorpusculum sp.]|nr:hypothetical protein [Methanocorpusculum sp.]
MIKTVLPSLRTLCPQAAVNLQKIMAGEFETLESIPEKTSVFQPNRPSSFEISQLFRVVLHKKIFAVSSAARKCAVRAFSGSPSRSEERSAGQT